MYSYGYQSQFNVLIVSLHRIIWHMMENRLTVQYTTASQINSHTRESGCSVAGWYHSFANICVVDRENAISRFPPKNSSKLSQKLWLIFLTKGSFVHNSSTASSSYASQHVRLSFCKLGMAVGHLVSYEQFQRTSTEQLTIRWTKPSTLSSSQ